MKIHFICTGNTFRSRLAEGYMRSKCIENLELSSSGLHADRNKSGTITWYAQKIAYENDFVKYMSPNWTLTNSEGLKDADLIIFLTQGHKEEFEKLFGDLPKDFKVWNIPDLCDVEGYPFENSNYKTSDEINATNNIFAQIKENIENLINEISEHL